MNSSMEKPYVVGIDIGGTNTVFGIVDARGTIIASGSIKTGVHDQADDYVDAVCKNLLPLIIANGGVDKIKGIGIGAPNGNYYSGTIEFAPNLPWKGVIPLASGGNATDSTGAFYSLPNCRIDKRRAFAGRRDAGYFMRGWQYFYL